MKALVVSADASCRRLLRQTLEERGHGVAEAGDIETAREACRDHGGSLVLLDWDVGAVDGLGLGRILRACRGETLGAILVLVDGAGPEEGVAALEAGADDVLAKPVDRGALRGRLIWAERLATEREARRDADEERDRELHFFHSLMNGLPDPIYFKDADSRFTRLNQAAAAALGCERPDQVLGRTDAAFYPAPLADRFFADERRILATGECLSNRIEPQTDGGPRQRWLLTTKSPVYGPDGAIMGIVGTAKDVTEHQRTEQALAGQRRVLELLAAGATLPRVLDALCRSLEATIDGALCSVLLLDEQGHRLHYGAAPSLPAAFTAALDGVEVGPNVGSCGSAAFTGEPVVTEDVVTDPRWTDFRVVALRHGLRSCWSMPIRDVGDSRVLGTFAVYHREPRRPGEADMARVTEAGHLAGIAIGCKRTEEALRRSEVRFRSLVEHSSDLVTIVDRAYVRRYASPSYEQVLGFRPEELVGHSIGVINHPDDAEVDVGFFADLARRPGAVDRFEARVRHRDGSTRWLETVVANRLDDPSVDGFVVTSRDVTHRKRSEEALRGSERRYRALAATSQRQAQELALLDQVRSALARELDLPALFRTAVEATAAVFGYPLVSLYLLEDQVLVLQHQTGYERVIARIAVTAGVIGRVVRGGEPELVTDAAADPDCLMAVEGITSEVCVPLRDQGRVVGALILESRGGDLLAGDDLRLMLAVAEHIDVAIGRARLHGEVRASEARFRALVRNAPDLITILDADGTIRYKSPAHKQILGYDPDELVGENALALVHPDDLPRVGEFFAESVAQPGVNVPVEFRFRHKDGSWLWLEAIATNLLGEPNVGGIVVNSRDVTERKRAKEHLAHLAYHDPLTDLPNRAHFLERLDLALARARRGDGPVAVLFLDLDGFKLINDSYGHDAGDRLLTEVGRRLSGALGPGETLARLGGDEFAVLLEGATAAEEGARAAARLIAALRDPIVLDGVKGYVTASVGVSVSTQRRSRPFDLLRSADIALYQAKAAGRGTFAIFEPRMQAPVTERLERETALRRALERDELRLYYQPVVDLATGRIVGVEALARWAHPERGVLPPSDFIWLAEETGLIVPLGRWALHEACRQARQWQDARPTAPPLLMSVNVSSRQLQRSDLAAEVAAALDDAGLDPGRLELEITESVAMTDAPEIRRSLRALRQLGVRLTLEDFGTGYSALSALRQLPFNALKIDGTFVAGLGRANDDLAIVGAVVKLAHDLGLEVTAEGVETGQQVELLGALGVDRGQGFYFAPPASSAAISDVLARAARLPEAPVAGTVATRKGASSDAAPARRG